MSTPTVDDAMAALARGDADTVSSFLQSLASRAEIDLPTEAHGFALEAAMQHGFDTIDDNAELYIVSAKALAAFIVMVRGLS